MSYVAKQKIIKTQRQNHVKIHWKLKRGASGCWLDAAYDDQMKVKELQFFSPWSSRSFFFFSFFVLSNLVSFRQALNICVLINSMQRWQSIWDNII